MKNFLWFCWLTVFYALIIGVIIAAGFGVIYVIGNLLGWFIDTFGWTLDWILPALILLGIGGTAAFHVIYGDD